MAILVTGATGLVGSQIVEDLVEGGHAPDQLRVLVRPSSDATFLREKKVQLCYGDVLDLESLKPAMKDVEIVFHAAAALMEKRKETFWSTNVDGTERVLRAARLAGVRKFVHLSTIGIYGLLGEIPAKEEHPKNPLRPYALAKLAAEEKVWESLRAFDLQAVAIRPTNIVGERDRTITPLIMRLIQNRVVPIIRGGRARVSFVHVKDVARAAILSSERDEAAGNAYNVAGFSAPLLDVFQVCMRIMGRRPSIINVPYPVAYIGALLIDGFDALARPRHAPLLARKGIQQLSQDLLFDTTKIRTELGFEPCYGMEESFLRAIRWQQEHGW